MSALPRWARVSDATETALWRAFWWLSFVIGWACTVGGMVAAVAAVVADAWPVSVLAGLSTFAGVVLLWAMPATPDEA